MWGWRTRVSHTKGEDHEVWQSHGDRVGWVVGDGLYLESDAAYKAAQSMLNSDSIPIGAHTLWKRMAERGLLVTTEQRSRGTLTIRKMLGGFRRKVLHLKIETFIPARSDQSDQSDQQLHSAVKNAAVSSGEDGAVA